MRVLLNYGRVTYYFSPPGYMFSIRIKICWHTVNEIKQLSIWWNFKCVVDLYDVLQWAIAIFIDDVVCDMFSTMFRLFCWQIGWKFVTAHICNERFDAVQSFVRSHFPLHRQGHSKCHDTHWLILNLTCYQFSRTCVWQSLQDSMREWRQSDCRACNELVDCCLQCKLLSGWK
jgi:hypothetical protein